MAYNSLSELFDAIAENTVSFNDMLTYMNAREGEAFKRGWDAAESVYKPIVESAENILVNRG